MAEARSVGYTFYARDQFDAVARRVSTSMDRVRDSINKVDTAATRSNRSSAQTASGWEAIGRNAKRFAAAYLSLRTVQRVVAETATAETALLKVFSAISDTTAQDAYRSRIEAVIATNRALGFSLDEVSDSLARQIQTTGLSDRAFARFTAASRLAKAAFIPLSEAVGAVSTLTEAYPELAADPGRAARTVFAAKGRTDDFEGLLATLPQVSQLSERAGLSPDLQMALFVALRNESKSKGVAGGAMAEIVKTLSELGTPAFDDMLAKNKVRGFPANLAGAGLAKQLQFFASLAQTQPAALPAIGISGAAQSLLLTMTKEDIAKIGATERGIRRDVDRGVMDQQFDRVQASLASSFSNLNAALGNLAGVLGTQIAPAVTTIANGMARGINAVAAANLDKGAEIDRYLGVKPGDSMPDILAAIVRANQTGKGAAALDPGARPGR